MLIDIERKVLRILSNYDLGRRRVPTIKELCIKTGKDEEAIRNVLAVLARERYIQYVSSDPESITILERWERTVD